MPKIKPGGFKEDLFNSLYHISSAPLDDARLPTMRAMITYMNTENLEDKNKIYLFLKNLVTDEEISFRKVEPFGLASI